MASLAQLFSNLDRDPHKRGHQFECVCKWFLENDPEYKLEIKRVWLWKNWPHRWGIDKGIDLIAENLDGKIWAIQAKAYAAEHSVTKHDVDRFLSESSRKVIDYRLLLSTAAGLSRNALEAIEGQEKPVGYLLLHQLKKRELNWPYSPRHLSAKQPPRRKPRADQARAINDVVREFRKHDRGQLIRACGTGKTLISLWVAERMQSRRTLVLVPSLSLLSQTLKEWTAHSRQEFRFLPVCSDDTVRGEDHLISKTGEFGLPAESDPKAVAEFLGGKGNRVIFATYQSAHVVAAAYKQRGVPQIDLAIADEAHRCAGRVSDAYGVILDANRIRARRRLFMTATPRYLAETIKSKAEELELETASMDDPERFGPVFHELKFREAIRRKLLTDYEVVIIGIDDLACRKSVDQEALVRLRGKKTIDAKTLTHHVAVGKALRKYNLQRVITFHGRVSRAQQFAKDFPDMLTVLPKHHRPTGAVWAELVSGAMSTGKRSAVLDRLREVGKGEHGLVTNARCLGEGVDVPSLDGIAFIDPKESAGDIIQAVGRAIRRAENKKRGVIVLPVYISKRESEDRALQDSEFKQVWRVLRALRSHDDRLAEELDSIRTTLGKSNRVRVHLPGKITVDLPKELDPGFVDAFYLRTVKSITPLPRLTTEKILQWADHHHQKTGKWPKVRSGNVLAAPEENWLRVDSNLSLGLRGLPGGSSLAQLLQEKRDVRNPMALSRLTVRQILIWADHHHQKTGDWPTRKSGNVLAALEEEWLRVDSSLSLGLRGLPGGSSLAQLLQEKRDVRNRKALPRLTVKQILVWADHHHQKTGHWPSVASGMVLSAPKEKWRNVNNALSMGLRGLPGNSSIAKLLAAKRRSK